MSDTAQTLKELLGKSGKSFLAMSAVKSGLPMGLKRQLGITAATTGVKLKKILEPHLGENMEIRRKGNVFYLTLKTEATELVLKCLSSSQAKGPGAVGRSLPFLSRAELASVLNELIAGGRVTVTLNDKYEARLTASAPLDAAVGIREVQPKSIPPVSISRDRSRDFQAAFEALDHGKIFVRICDLRRHLGWPRDEFDAVLRQLRDRELIQLHSGDATMMTTDEVQDGFVDENGFRMGTVTWNGK